MARVTTHLSVSELEREYRAAKEATAARHYQAIWLLAKGHTGARAVAEEAERHPGKPIEVFASDQRPVALGHHRFEWLYVTAFVSPESGATFWYLSNGVSKAFFEELLAAPDTGVSSSW